MMNHKRYLVLIFVVALVALGVSILLGNSDKIGLCSTNIHAYDTGCIDKYEEAIAQPIFFFSLAFVIVCLILFFVREEVYKSWKRFAIWAVPIGIIILIIAPTSTTGTWLGGGDFTKETASWGVSILFLIISLIIIIRKSVLLKYGKDKLKYFWRALAIIFAIWLIIAYFL